MEIITHLYEHYTRKSPLDMAANNDRLWASYKAEEPLESRIERINECADFATAAGDPVLDT